MGGPKSNEISYIDPVNPMNPAAVAGMPETLEAFGSTPPLAWVGYGASLVGVALTGWGAVQMFNKKPKAIVKLVSGIGLIIAGGITRRMAQ
jgi:hypothetical protein